MLENINSTNDIKNLNLEELQELSLDVSNLIKEVVEKEGGHYSSPLGVVDLSVVLHHVYNSPLDKIVWDVGHQAYAHKILTGRKDSFNTLRKKGGISGFLKREESKHDIIGAGHASTSISAALGIAHARDFNKDNFNVLSVIGDGAMTGGLAYEAMKMGGNAPCILNAANEVAVEAFLNDQVGFLQMSDILEGCMAKVDFIKKPNYSDLVQTDTATRGLAKELIK